MRPHALTVVYSCLSLFTAHPTHGKGWELYSTKGFQKADAVLEVTHTAEGMIVSVTTSQSPSPVTVQGVHRIRYTGTPAVRVLYKVLDPTPIPDLVLSANGTIVTNSRTHDFRNTKWGMSVAQVLRIEPGAIQSKDSLLLEESIEGHQFLVAYSFLAGRLHEGKYILKDEFYDAKNYIALLAVINQRISTLYGSPIEDRWSWSENTYKDHPEQYGLALDLAHLSITTRWQTERSNITVTLGKAFPWDDISMVITYTQRLLEKREPVHDRPDRTNIF